MAEQQLLVIKLASLLDNRTDLKNALETSLQKANRPGLTTIQDFYGYLNSLLTHIPSEKDLMPSVKGILLCNLEVTWRSSKKG